MESLHILDIINGTTSGLGTNFPHLLNYHYYRSISS